MEKKIILELNCHNVYYIKTDTISYYITIPKEIVETNICIELKNHMGNYNIESNNEITVMKNIKNTFSYIDSYNITLILPILKEEQIGILEKIDNTKYEQIDKIIGEIINNAYIFLKENKKVVHNDVIIINNERYKTFINWFTSRYKNRVVCKTLIELIQLYNANATIYKKLETPIMNFVVGSYNNEITAPKVENKEPTEIKIETNKLQVSYGYASYWILAIVTLVVSAVIALIAFTYK